MPAGSNSSSRKAWRHHRRPRRELGQRLCRARRPASRRDPQRDQPARLAVLDPHHQPFRRRTAAVPAFGHDGSQGRRARLNRQGGAQRMIAGLPLTFAQPLLLLGLLSLPVLWWLLRVMPPRPRRIEFPPTRLLFDIRPKEETPSRTPWWLTLLRLAAAALRHPRRRRPDLESADRGRRQQRAVGDPARRRLECGRKLGHAGQGRGRTDRQRRQRPPRRRAGSAFRDRARHHADAGRHRAGRAAPDLAKTLVGRSRRHACRARPLPEGDRRCRDRVAVRRRRYRARR